MAFLRIELITHLERTLAITLVKDIILNAEGWIVSHQFFSNTFASLNFEIPYATIDSLLTCLKAEDFTFTLIEDCPRGKKGDVCGGVSLTFVHNKPDMNREVPPFG
ncbi:MAG: hypothetical protein COB54_02895 [Alphaproteobacteria bacterium]|nr:MAG: hypothetical protein COB54_02895 [Alphaproteobacteria bacterium]